MLSGPVVAHGSHHCRHQADINMESQEYSVRHFQDMVVMAEELGTLPAQILEHSYSYSSFGSWWTTLRRKGQTFRIVFDGKEESVLLERGVTTAGFTSWETLHEESTANGSVHAIREVVALLEKVGRR